ncbi:MAG: glycosyltransferase family 9 protein [Pseudobdellovibrio sp.]|nr:glycosyltransferase family 9 protein [Pseudobdellovibrio sp.]
MSYHVVVQTAFIGDVFLSIPFLKRLKALYPNDKVIFVAKKGVADYLLKLNVIDELITVNKGDKTSYNDAVKKINSHAVENVFCLHRSLRSALFTWKIKAQKKFGFSQGLNFLFFSESVKYLKTLPDAIRQMALLAPVDPKTAEKINEQDWSYLNFSDQEGKFKPIPEFFSMHVPTHAFNTDKKIALFPGSVWETKKWPVNYYSDLTEKLLNEGYQVYLMGGPDEAPLCQEIQSKNPKVEMLAGKMKLVDSIDFLKSCDLIIGNDSSPSHLGASVGTPVIAIFGPTTLNLGFRPWEDKSIVIENRNLECRPCGLHGHHKCPLGHHKCMKEIMPEHVFHSAKKVLKAQS